MDRSLGFGSMPCNCAPCSDSVSLRLRDSHPLTSLHVMTRRLILQKARRHPSGLRPLAGPWFQVLFHSPPGVLFTFPSRYYALSVDICVLPWRVVPPASHGVSRVPRYSGFRLLSLRFRLPGSHCLRHAFPGVSANFFLSSDGPQPR